jgi:hypothetical protein
MSSEESEVSGEEYLSAESGDEELYSEEGSNVSEENDNESSSESDTQSKVCTEHGKRRAIQYLELKLGEDYRCVSANGCSGFGKVLCNEHQKLRFRNFLDRFQSVEDGSVIYNCKEDDSCKTKNQV